jgi:hypothetical protein
VIAVTTGKLVAASGVLAGIAGVGIGAWWVLTRDIHTLKDIAPDVPGAPVPGLPGVVGVPPAPPLGHTGWKRIDAILPQLRAAAASSGIPLGVMVGWIAKESGGKLTSHTSLDERGYFQLMPSESGPLGIDHERLSDDSQYSIDAGVKLIKKYQAAIDDLAIPGATAGNTYYWRLVKLAHSMGAGQVKKIAKRALTDGHAGSWEDLEDYAEGIHILGPQPKKWFPFVDSVYVVGLPFGFGSQPALVGSFSSFLSSVESLPQTAPWLATDAQLAYQQYQAYEARQQPPATGLDLLGNIEAT